MSRTLFTVVTHTARRIPPVLLLPLMIAACDDMVGPETRAALEPARLASSAFGMPEYIVVDLFNATSDARAISSTGIVTGRLDGNVALWEGLPNVSSLPGTGMDVNASGVVAAVGDDDKAYKVTASSVTQISLPATGPTGATLINDDGLIAGYWPGTSVACPSSNALFMMGNGFLIGTTRCGEPTGITETGVVGGHHELSLNYSEVWAWDGSSEIMSDGHSNSVLTRGVSSTGVVHGQERWHGASGPTWYAVNFGSGPFLWREGEMGDINDEGTIAYRDGTTAMVIPSGGNPISLGAGQPKRVTNGGLVAGQSAPGYAVGAWVFNPASGLHDLPLLPNTFAVVVNDANDDGAVVGLSLMSNPSASRATLWTKAIPFMWELNQAVLRLHVERLLTRRERDALSGRLQRAINAWAKADQRGVAAELSRFESLTSQYLRRWNETAARDALLRYSGAVRDGVR